MIYCDESRPLWYVRGWMLERVKVEVIQKELGRGTASSQIFALLIFLKKLFKDE
jgi:hypothetical protein